VKNVTDEELILLTRNGDTEAEEELLLRYRPAVKREVRFLFLVGAETEDLIQEAMIGLVKAIREYSPEKEAVFHTFATWCIRNQIRNAIRNANRQKHQPLNSYISIYADQDSPEDMALVNSLEASPSVNPEQVLIEREELLELKEELMKPLSALEREVAELYLEGLSYREIAEKIGKPERSVNNAMLRIRTKLRKEKK